MRLLEPLSILASLALHAAAIGFLVALWSNADRRPAEVPSISTTIEVLPIREVQPAEPDRESLARPPQEALADGPSAELHTQPADVSPARPPAEVMTQASPEIPQARPESRAINQDTLPAPVSQPTDSHPTSPDLQVAADPDTVAVAGPEQVPIAKSEEVTNVPQSMDTAKTRPPSEQPVAPPAAPKPVTPPVKPVAPATKQESHRAPEKTAPALPGNTELPRRASAAPHDDGAAIARYAAGLAVILRSHTSFPGGAPSGTAVVHYSVDRNGRLLGRNLVRSSGSSLLDAAALATVDQSSPFFPPFPADITRSRLEVTVPLAFHAR